MIHPRKTRRQAKAEQRFVAAVAVFISDLGARPDSFYDYALDTPAGILHVSVHETWVATRFADVALGQAFTASCGSSCNPYSGKWNFHFPSGIDPERAVADLRFWFERLTNWNPEEETPNA